MGRVRPEPDSPPARSDTIFCIASITSTITATAVMILVEEGRLGLNLPVSLYVPEFAGDGKDAVTILHLLTHTSGLRDQEIDEYAGEVRGTVRIPPPESTQHPEMAKHLSLRYAAPLWKSPGQEMSYCNWGYCLLGEVVRRVTGRPLGDFAAERIYWPLGMKDTSYCFPDSRKGRVAWPADPEELQSARRSREVPYSGAAVFATAVDLAVFGQALLDGGQQEGIRILSPVAVAAMTRNQTPGISARWRDEVFPEACWGLGWGTLADQKGVTWGLSLASPAAFYHHGAGGAFCWVDPGYDLVGVYLPAENTSHSFARFDFAVRRYYGAYLFADAVTASIVDTKSPA